MEFYLHIGAKIKEARESQGLSQGELGEKIGYSATAINYYEKGKRKIEKELLSVNKKIDNLLDILEAGEISNLIKDRLKQNAELKSQLEKRLQEITSPPPLITENIIKKMIENLRVKEKSPEERRAVFSKLKLKIYASPDEVSISFGERNGVINYGVGDGTRRLITLFAELLHDGGGK